MSSSSDFNWFLVVTNRERRYYHIVCSSSDVEKERAWCNVNGYIPLFTTKSRIIEVLNKKEYRDD